MIEKDATNLHVVRNEGMEPLRLFLFGGVDPTKKHYDEDLLEPGFVRVYEFLHGYEDTPIAEYDRPLTPEQQEFYQIFTEEIRKTIDQEIVTTICRNAT